MLTNLPQLNMAVRSWANRVQIGLICKSQQDFKTVESIVYKIYSAVIQPLQVKQLMIKPEGERSWKWYWLHVEPSLDLQVDDVVYLDDDTPFRVMGRKDYSLYGYIEYELVRGYEYP